jgi:ketosteroid isomerase-like protein
MCVGTASASEKTDVMAVMHRWVDTFNKGDVKSSLAACADQAVVIDENPLMSGRDWGMCRVEGCLRRLGQEQ